jgi:hypothetical protein
VGRRVPRQRRIDGVDLLLDRAGFASWDMPGSGAFPSAIIPESSDRYACRALTY